MTMLKMNKREKVSLGLLGVGAAALLVSSNIETAPVALFNPESSGSMIRRALAVPIEEIRALNLAVTGYDTSQGETLPAFYDNVANVWDAPIEDDQAFMWYVPKAGGNTIAKVFGKCLEFVTCSSMAATVGNGTEPTNQMVIKEDPKIGKFVNVDPSTPEGIAKAKSYNVVLSREVKVIISQLLADSATLFSQSHKGRFIAMLRHPVKRAADNFYYRQSATWEQSFDRELALMSIDDFASSDRHIENFVVRSLVGKPEVEVTVGDVELAKAILRRKFIIGIAEENLFDLSIVRFEKYFGWWEEREVLTNHTVNYCHHYEVTHGQHFGTHPKVLQGSSAYNKLASRNWADIELFMYAKNTLFTQQSVLI